jgi:tRNA (adenine22-N1)-methyltransferase
MEHQPPILKLDSRLAAVADNIKPCRTIADIGSDHAYLPIFLLLQNTAERAIVTDIHSGPLQNSRENAVHYGVSDRCDFRLGDGFSPLRMREANTIAICGMGGDTIASILTKSAGVTWNCRRLVLQPMTRQPY